MRVTIDYQTRQMIDEILETCKDCELRSVCKEPYRSRKDVVRAALTKFTSLDCIPEEDPP